jgi:hypothetical protein
MDRPPLCNPFLPRQRGARGWDALLRQRVLASRLGVSRAEFADCERRDRSAASAVQSEGRLKVRANSAQRRRHRRHHAPRSENHKNEQCKPPGHSQRALLHHGFLLQMVPIVRQRSPIRPSVRPSDASRTRRGEGPGYSLRTSLRKRRQPLQSPGRGQSWPHWGRPSGGLVLTRQRTARGGTRDAPGARRRTNRSCGTRPWVADSMQDSG